MSWQPASDPRCDQQQEVNPIEMVIVPRARDLGGFEVRRALPSARRQMVGPFIFFDQMGPAEFLLGQGIDVRPHPHIGLATVTYLLRGEIIHRDSLGTLQPIRPGEVNLMTAGRGVVHSERTDAALRASGPRLHGIQSWMALPDPNCSGIAFHWQPVRRTYRIPVKISQGKPRTPTFTTDFVNWEQGLDSFPERVGNLVKV